MNDRLSLAVGSTWLLTRTTDPEQNLRRVYTNARGAEVAVKEFNTIGVSTTSVALVTQYQYNALDEVVKVIDAKSNQTTAEYDTRGQIVAVVSPDAGRTEYRFDLGGNLGAKQPAKLGATAVIRYEYDFNRLKRITYPTTPAVTFDYGAATETGDANGNRAGRIKRVTMEGGTEDRWYDRLGAINKTVTTLKHLREPNIPPQVFTMKFSYDQFGRMLNMTFPNWINDDWTNLAGEGELVRYFYDKGGLLDRITGFHQTPNPHQTTHPRDFVYLQHIGYDEFEQKTLLRSGNGIDNKYFYEPFTRRLASLDATAKQGTVPFHRLRYTYDRVGNILKIENATSVLAAQNDSVRTGPMRMTFTYDRLHQVTSATGLYRGHPAYGYQYASTFQYDQIGNLTKKSQSEDRLVWDNQNPPAGLAALTGGRFDHNVRNFSNTMDYVYAGSRPHAATKITETQPASTPADRLFTYDASGNNTGNTFQGTTRQMIWDEESRLKQVNDNGGMKVKVLYDPLGERTQKQTAAGDAYYVNQFYVFQPNKLPTKHIFAGDMRIVSKTDPISSQVPVVSTYHSDHIGSTSYTTNPNQELMQHERYFPFGERDIGDQEECDLGRPDNMRRDWLFNSKELDWDTGLFYFGARYYEPRTAQWQSPDPALVSYLKGSGNGGVFAPANLALYSYSYNNPVRLRDADGRIPIDTVWDLGNVIWDAGKIGVGYATGNAALMAEGTKDLALDAAAMAVPYLPAGASKIARLGAQHADEAVDAVKAVAKTEKVAVKAEKAVEAEKAVTLGKQGAEGVTESATKGTAGGTRAGKSFTPKGKSEIDAESATRHAGSNVCENCGTQFVPGQRSQAGVKPPRNERQRDHIVPKSKGGDGSPPNGQILCRGCNIEKSNR